MRLHITRAANHQRSISPDSDKDEEHKRNGHENKSHESVVVVLSLKALFKFVIRVCTPNEVHDLQAVFSLLWGGHIVCEDEFKKINLPMGRGCLSMPSGPRYSLLHPSCDFAVFGVGFAGCRSQ